MRTRRSALPHQPATMAIGTALLLSVALSAAALAGPCAVPSPSHATIQSAADDFRCSEVLVAAGVYVEQLSIGRNISLRGAGAGRTTIASPTRRSRSTVRTSVLPSFTYVIQVKPGSKVAISDLSVDGQSSGRCGERYFGIRYSGSSGSLTRVVLQNVNGSGSDATCADIIAIGVTAEASEQATLTIADSTVRSFQQYGVLAQGSTVALNLKDSIVHGAGAQKSLPQTGIRLTAGAKGLLDRATLTDLTFSGDPCVGVGTGIELAAAGATTITAAALLTVDRGLSLSKNVLGPVAVRSSRFIENLSGILSAENGSGLVTLSGNAFISTKRSSAATVATCFAESGDAIALRSESGSIVSGNSAGDSGRCALELLGGTSDLDVNSNQAVRSARVDLEDGGSGNRLSKNRCLTSTPSGLCSAPPSG